MSQLNTRRTYDSLATLLQSDIDLFLNDIETFFNITKLNDENIQDASITASTKISPLSITTSKFKNLSVTTAKILNDNITTAKINDLAVTTAKILDANVTTAKINDLAVTTAKILDANVTTAKILDANITNAKLVASNYQISSSCGAASGGGDIANLSVSITTSGFPVMIVAIPDGSGIDSSFLCNGTNTSSTINIIRDATTLFKIPILISNPFLTSSGINLPPSIVYYVDDTPTSGTYTYKLNATNTAGGFYANYMKLVAIELVR